MQSLQQFIVSISSFINGVLIPFLFALALLFFIYNAFKYFILEGAEAKEEAKTMAIYGIAGFVILVSIWGIVNVLMSGLGLRQNDPITPDYFGTSQRGGSDSFFQFSLYFGGEAEDYNPNDANVRENNFWGN